MDVVARGDNLTEQDIVRVVLQSSLSYALGPKNTADVLIYDGPYWTIQSLEPTAVPNESEVRAVNGTRSAAGTWIAPPQAVGWASWSVNGVSETHGTHWNVGNSPPWVDFGIIFRPYGISSRASTQQNSVVVGTLGTAAYKILDNGTGGVTLPHFSLSGGGAPSKAQAISPDASRVVGYSTVSGNRRPALWVGNASPVDLSSGIENPQNQYIRVGEAMAVNNAGVIVGFSSGFSKDFQGLIHRPFRNDGSGAVFDDTDDLALPASGTGVGTANSVTTTSFGTHHAVGWYEPIQDVRQGILWSPSGVQTLPSLWIDLKTLDRSGTRDKSSEAMGINSSLKIVGWSGNPVDVSTRKAVLFNLESQKWQDLNDRHFVHNQSGWTLRSAQGVSDGNVIVGNGLLFGAPKAFILIPRVDEN